MRLSTAQQCFRKQHPVSKDILDNYEIRALTDVKYSIIKKATLDSYIVEIVGEQGQSKKCFEYSNLV